MSLHKSILRAYDIRGIVGETLHEGDALAIGRAFGTYVINASGNQAPKIAVGYDGRKSSPALKKKLIEGIASTGAEVIEIGVGPSPMLYFSVKNLKLDAGVMITGSHNPPTHNGFKFMLSKRVFFGEDIEELGKIAASGEFIEGKGAITEKSVFKDYVSTILGGYESSHELKVAWDPGNGAAGDVVTAIVAKLPGEHILLNEKIDGNFPAHHPDPSEPENLEQLIEVVKREGCDLGVAFDGDGDRVGAVDGQGRVLFGDQLMVFFARDVLETKPGATIIADVKASQSLFDEIERMGGVPLIWKTGHSFIKAKIAETGAALAGEMSGHVFFADKYYGYDDGIYSAIRLINLVAKSGNSLADMLDRLPKMHNTPEIRIECGEERKFTIIEEVKERLKEDGVNFSDIDGVRVMTDEGWWLLRASNTQAILVARCEGKSEESLDKLKGDLEEQLRKSNINLLL